MEEIDVNEKNSFDLNILIKLGNLHKKLMKELGEQINNFNTDKDIYLFINDYLKENELKKAFPIGISINQIIAHDSFHQSNITRLKKGDFIKIDVGLIEDGNIIDSARTFVYNDNVPKCIDDCKTIAKSIEESISKTVIEGETVQIQKISALTNALIVMKGYVALDYLGGHTIEYGKVHGKHLILNKPYKLLPKEAHQFIDPNAEISEGEMFAIEIYIGEKKALGTMIKNNTISTTHYQINENTTKYELDKLTLDEKNVYLDIMKITNNLVYGYNLHLDYNKNIIKKLIDLKYIIKHEPLEFKSNIRGEKIKYIQYEDCFIIKDNQLINLTG